MGSSGQVTDQLASSDAHPSGGQPSGGQPSGGQPSGGRPARSWTGVTRVRQGRVLGGVCAGVARAFGINPVVVRILAVALVFAGGSGALLYVVAWLLLPQEGADRSLAQAAIHDRRYDPAEMTAVGAVVLGSLLIARETGVWFGDAVVWPLFLAGVGLAVIWRQAGDDDRASLLRVVDRIPAVDTRSRRAALARVVVGVALVVSGVGAFLAASDAFSAVRQALFATAGIVAGLAVITLPWWLRLGRDLARERRERIRSEERAEVAAHLHDSVLQTLALIQRNADDPRAVVTMARRQERELRAWLYRGDEPPAATEAASGLSAAVTRAAEEVEVDHGVSIDVVAVGDAPLDDRLEAMVAAAREAMVNAAKWSGATAVSVYVEAAECEVKVFVRDWGGGFDPAAVADDRHGLRESITGRMARHGGQAVVRTAVGEGTEVQLRVPGDGR
jgi:signal transduction histidine kinase/phage shock protein PspC (stress-responsive transcriptional regulator)